MNRGRSSPTRRTAALRWLGESVVRAFIVLWASATLVFFITRLVPGDPAEAALGGPGSQASEEAVEAVRRQFGFDQPLVVQYGIAMLSLLRLDLGSSYALRQPVATILLDAVPGTLVLAVLALLVAWILAIGLTLAQSQGSRIAARIGDTLEIVASALPHFWLATILIAVFSTALSWFPPVSTGTPTGLVLPVVTLAVPIAGFLAQVMRGSLQEALDAPFATSALARGETRVGLRVRHALRHAALPALGLSAWAFGYLIGGAVVVETIFARPGLGRTLLSAITVRDIPVVTGVVLVSALVYVILTLVTDAVTRLVDPRTAVGGR
ncbi:ABC transporter permease [Labedella endophytica]|uniref:ABC transporter permease n=1 Tax=Labedella endophytica TaxID=1523160 RepID=UPI001FB638E6|nr:ABC transporter permease [Labedella endophytica]